MGLVRLNKGWINKMKYKNLPILWVWGGECEWFYNFCIYLTKWLHVVKTHISESLCKHYGVKSSLFRSHPFCFYGKNDSANLREPKSPDEYIFLHSLDGAT